MPAPSSLSITARALRTHLAAAIGLPESQILIGPPNQAVKDIEGEANKQFLNLFFYRIEQGSSPVDGAAEDPFFLRLYCLITALGTKETVGANTVSAGENDLRLVGSILTHLHQQPILLLQGESSDVLAQLQIVLHSLTLDDINHIWATQGHTPYRLSVGYEISLLPLPLQLLVDRAPRVGSIGLSIHNDSDGTSALAPQVPAVTVDSTRADWAAHLACFTAEASLQYSLVFSASEVPASLTIVAIGAPGATVQLEWEVWSPESSWTSGVATPAMITLATDALDPRDAAPGTQTVALPLQSRGQAMLFAFRDFVRIDGSIVRLRSNPILVSVQ